MKLFIWMTLLLTPSIQLMAQDALTMFEPLMDKTWRAEGQWGDGHDFKQEIRFRYDLNNAIVIVESKGFTDEHQSVFGNRNHGIRQWDKTTGQVRFWEFDTFGGVTIGVCNFDNGNIYYRYEYPLEQGTMTLTDAWIRVDSKTYEFKVGVFENHQWKSVFLETQFVGTTE